MKQLLLILLVVGLVIGNAAQAKEPPEQWPSMEGVYSGKVEIYNRQGSMMESDVMLEIRKTDRKHYTVDLIYFTSSTAKFTKCARIGKHRLNIYDRIVTDNKRVVVTGSLSSDDGSLYSGKIRFDLVSSEGEKNIYRSFVLKSLRLAKSK